MRQNKVFVLAVLLLALVFAWGCGAKKDPPPTNEPALVQEPETEKAPEPEPVYVHTVKWPGETLSVISLWYTSSVANWRAIARANPDLDPNQMRIGDRIEIPQKLMKVSDPLPKGFVDRFVQKPPAPAMAEPAASTREAAQEPARVMAPPQDQQAAAREAVEEVAGVQAMEEVADPAVQPMAEEKPQKAAEAPEEQAPPAMLFGPKE